MNHLASYLHRTSHRVSSLTRPTKRQYVASRYVPTSLTSLRYFSGAPDAPVSQRVIDVVKGFEKLQGENVNITAETRFGDVGLDSLDTVEVVLAIEEEFGIDIPDDDALKILSVGDAIKYLEGRPEVH